MVKSVIKEIIIFLLLLVAIALLLGILFYDYMPNTKVIPSKVVPYELSEDIQEEIASTQAEGQNIIKTYSVDSSDLKLYENSNKYKKGKVNPFEAYSEPTNDGNSNTSNNNSDNTNTNSSNNNSVGNFFDDEGK